jgi:hypothetical protein
MLPVITGEIRLNNGYCVCIAFSVERGGVLPEALLLVLYTGKPEGNSRIQNQNACMEGIGKTIEFH